MSPISPSAISSETDPPALPRPAANILAVASGKGGVGKTFFSVTLTHAIARIGKRALLFDGDLGTANIDIHLGLMPTRDLGGVMAGRLTLAQARVPFDAGGFDIIAGRSGSGGLASLSPARLAGLGADISALASDYDRVILDLGAGLDRTVRHLAGLAAVRLVVVTGEPTSLTDAYAFIKTTIIDDPHASLRIVVNQARSHAEGERTYNTLLKACESFLKLSPALAGVVRKDRKVGDTIRAQTPLLLKFPNADAAQDIVQIAQDLVLKKG